MTTSLNDYNGFWSVHWWAPNSDPDNICPFGDGVGFGFEIGHGYDGDGDSFRTYRRAWGAYTSGDVRSYRHKE